MMNQSCMKCYVSGKVQGVWFRASAKEEAEQLSIKGWAKNLADGRVEVVACGTNENLELFYHWLKQGPRLAEVMNVTREDLLWKNYHGFDLF